MTDAAFTIPLWADLTAVTVGGAQGALVASRLRDRRLDLLGVAIVGFASALGGGLLRDLVLVTPPVAFRTDWYLLVAVGASLAGMLLARVLTRLTVLLTGLDALMLGLFGAIGASKALAFGLPVVPAVFVGVLSAVGGGLLRDLLLAVPISLLQVGSLYAVAAGAGSIVLVAMARFGVPVALAAIAGASATTAIRLAALKFGWRLPEQRTLSRLPRLARRRAEPIPTTTGAYRLPRRDA